MSGDSRRKAKLHATINAALAESERLGDSRAGFVVNRIAAAGYQIGDYESCPICGAAIVKNAQRSHMAFHGRASMQSGSLDPTILAQAETWLLMYEEDDEEDDQLAEDTLIEAVGEAETIIRHFLSVIQHKDST